MVPRSTERQGAARWSGRPRRKETRKMRAYYWKVFKHLLSTTVLTGFGTLN
jgi:hypothetical protein